MQIDSLVAYKHCPAQLTDIQAKLHIRLSDGVERSVREKDVIFLHPGPVTALSELENSTEISSPQEAWEILQGESPSLKDIAELIYGVFTPSSAWMTFKLLNHSPWFRGTPEDITVMDRQSVEAYMRDRKEKEESENRWNDFIERFKAKQIDVNKDELFLRDLEMYALGRSKGSRILKTLGKIQNPENAHRVMLQYGIKKETWNPHPLRLDVLLDIPDFPVPDFPDDERLDLTGIESFAIDDEGNQDPDDALSWDGERFWVHVADVGALFPAESQADLLARERGSSLYLPEKTVPMLPPSVIGRLGLGLMETSNALSYAFQFDDDFNVSDFSVHLTKVKVSRYSYAQADDLLDKEPLRQIKRVTDAFAAKRKAAGAIQINIPEVKIHVDSKGHVQITSLPELDSRQMVAEAMLLTGCYAAKMCHDAKIPIPFVVQDAGPDANNIRTGLVGEFERRRGMKRSRATLKCGRHHGLGLEHYTRVTSPIRRYTDMIASRQIRQHILKRPVENAQEILTGLASFESQLGNLIQAERKSIMFWKMHWLKQHPGYRTKALHVDRRDRHAVFFIPEISLEILLIPEQEIPLGQEVTLKLKSVDLVDLTAIFVFA